MKFKFMTLLLCVLMSLSLISYGFASWIITDGDFMQFNGSVYTEQVTNSDDCIKILNPESITLKYSPTGFVDKNNFITNVGIISITYEINLENCKYYYGENYNSLQVVLSLESNYANYNLFKTISSVTTGTDVQYSSDVIDITEFDVSSKSVTGKDDNMYILTFTINNILSSSENSVSFSVDYLFNVNLYHYADAIYEHMSEISFTTSAMVNGDNYE